MVLISRVTDLSNTPIKVNILTEAGWFEVVLPISICAVEIPGATCLNVLIDSPIYQVNVRENSVIISDGVILSTIPSVGPIEHVTYVNENNMVPIVMESGYIILRDLIPS